MNIAICDDRENELENIRSIVQDYAISHPEFMLKLSCFLNPLDMIDDIRKNGAPDIALLDICVPGGYVSVFSFYPLALSVFLCCF